jgi:tol-pal system protein YbgF
MVRYAVLVYATLKRRQQAAALLVALISGGCATTPPPAAPTPAVAKDDEDIHVLKERVSRLERRLAEADAKIALLSAQRSQSSRPPQRSVSMGDLGPRELIVDDNSRDEASLGARSIDLGPKKRAQEPEPQPYAEDLDNDGNDDAITIKMSGDGPATVTAGGPPAGASVEETYAWGQSRLKEGGLLEAIAAFEEITERYPLHDLADNAMYWIGYAHQQRSDHKLAVDVWQRLPMKYPKSPKIPDALFGMAISHEAIGEPAVSEMLYEQLVNRYPKAEKVRDARKALQRLRPK